MEFGPWAMGTTQLKFEPVTVAGIPRQLTEAMPDRRSVAVPLTVTDGGLTVALSGGPVMVRTGGVLSIFTGGETKLALLPATSVTITLPLTEPPSADKDKGLGIEVAATPERASVAVNAKLTFELFQPAA